MAEWLSTRQAAERLGVSEASVRRWSDRGILPVQRVGRRGERRFQSDHLERFGQSNRSVYPTVHSRGDVPTVVVGAAAIPAYSHLATFYDTDEGRLRLATPFAREGLLAGEPCLLAMQGPDLESHLASLRRAGIDLDGVLQTGQLRVWTTPTTTVDEALRFLEDWLWEALTTRAPVIRVLGEASSQRTRFGSDADQHAFDAAVNLLTRRFPCLVLCQYDVRTFSGPALLAALRAHPDLLDLPLRTLLS